MLRASRFEVSVFESGEELLASLDARVPDCIVLDYHLAASSAPDVQHLLSGTNRKIPVVVITGNECAGMRQRCIANGASDFLLKPLRREELIASITGAIRQSDRK